METLIHKHFVAYLKTTGELSTWVAGLSFAVGTAFFSALKFGHRTEDMAFLSLLFLMFAMLLNAIVMLNLLILFCSYKQYREYFAIKILIVLANIPIALFYLKTL